MTMRVMVLTVKSYSIKYSILQKNQVVKFVDQGQIEIVEK